jgi:plastocyanin
VAARRLLIVMLVLLGVSTVAAALVPVERDADGDDTTTTSTTTTKRPTWELMRESIHAVAREPQTVRVRVGDQLQLEVTSRRAHQVEIPRLGELEDVDPDAPAHFDLLLFDRGRFPVRLVEPERKIGEIVVGRPQPASAKKGEKQRREQTGKAPAD